MKNSFYDIYHKKTRSQQRIISDNSFVYKHILKILNSILRKERVKKILDIGCGAGTLAFYFANKGCQVTGVDVSKKSVALCKKSAKELELNNTSFLLSNFPDDDIKGGYDLVVLAEVIEHIEDDKIALRKIYKLLKKGGMLYLSTPSQNAPLYRLGLLNKFDREVGHVRRYGERELRKKLKSSGFKIVKAYKKEGILRNSLFTNDYLGKIIKFIKGPLVDAFMWIDDMSVKLFGESDLIIVTKKR